MRTPLPRSFIVNLCALPAPQVPPQALTIETQHLRFFVSRRKVEGGERFYLHVGFLPTLAEAEHWRDILRSRYPNAFVSQLGSRPAVSAADTTVLSATETLRVLEARPPRRDDDRDEHTETGFYNAIASEAQSRSQAPPPPTVRTALSLSSPAAVRNTVTEPTGRATRTSRDLAAELKDLAAEKPDEPEHADLSSTTGVRHLRIEFVRKAKRAPKPSTPPRRS
jgi:hypothetical protein